LLGVLSREKHPSAFVCAKAVGGFLVLATPVTLIFEDLVYAPKIKRLNEPLVRSRIFGGLLVFFGIIAQLISAIADFLRSSMP
jgi:hypothetical protein